MTKNRSQRVAARRDRARSYGYAKWKNSPKRSARVKHMIYAVSKPCGDEFWNEPNLPWNPHPLSYYDGMSQRDKAILRKAKKLLPEDGIKELMYYLNETMSAWGFDIVFKDVVTGNRQECGTFFDHEYVDQYENGGYTGDSYAGYMYLPLTPKRYFKFQYAD